MHRKALPVQGGPRSLSVRKKRSYKEIVIPIILAVLITAVATALLDSSEAGTYSAPPQAFATYVEDAVDEKAGMEQNVEQKIVVASTIGEVVETTREIKWADEEKEIPRQPIAVNRAAPVAERPAPIASTTTSREPPAQQRKVSEQPKASPKNVRQASTQAAAPTNPCGTMRNCMAVIEREPSAVGVLRACKSVLNGGGTANAKASCNQFFARIDVPQEAGFTDEQRQAAAARVCRGMPDCNRVVMSRPSAVTLVNACAQALVHGSGPAADTCDRSVMSRI